MTQRDRPIESLKLGSAAQVLPIVIGFGTIFLTTPYVVSRLGLHDFGVWSITGAIAQYAGLLDLGISRAVTRYVALFHAKSDAKGQNAVVGVSVTVLAILGALLIGLCLLVPSEIDRVLGTHQPDLVRLLLLCAVVILILSLLARVLAAASIGRGRLVASGIGLAVFSAVQALAGAAALMFEPSLKSYGAGSVGGAVLGLLLVVVIIFFDHRGITIGKPSASLAREMLAYGFQSQVAAAGYLVQQQSGKLIAGFIIGPAAAGVYELANRLAVGAESFGAAPGLGITAHLTRVYLSGGIDAILSQYERLTRRNTAVVIFVPFAMAATAFSAIPLWLGGGKGQVVLFLLALLPGVAVNSSTNVCIGTALAIGRPAITAHVAVVSSVVQMAFAVTLCYMFGLGGLAASFGLGVPATKLLGLWYMQARMRIPMNLYIRGSAGPFAIGVFAVAIALPIGLFAAPVGRASAIWPFLGSALLFSATYCLLAWTRDYLPRLPLPVRRPRRSVQNTDANQCGESLERLPKQSSTE